MRGYDCLRMPAGHVWELIMELMVLFGWMVMEVKVGPTPDVIRSLTWKCLTLKTAPKEII